jgi:hypothetical protein
MCMDPHAVAKVRARALLTEMEQLLLGMQARNAGVSSVHLTVLCVLQQRLGWCDESYSRRRSVQLLWWVLKRAAELLIRVIEASLCLPSARHIAHRRIHDTWYRHQTPAFCGWMVATGLRSAA